jgi:proline racemase
MGETSYLQRQAKNGERHLQMTIPRFKASSPVNALELPRRITMKRVQSILCASALTLAFASTALGGNITLQKASGNITLQKASGNITLQKASGNITLQKASGNITLQRVSVRNLSALSITDYFYLIFMSVMI